MANQTKQHDWKAIEGFAVKFSKDWEGAASEKSQALDFIRAFLFVFGVPRTAGEPEKPIKTASGRTNYIDFFFKDKIAIEMKSRGKKLDNAFEQLNDYMEHLPEGEEPPDLWMVSDFENIHLYHRPTEQAFDFKTKKLRKYVRHFAILADYEFEYIRSDKGAVDLQATAKMNKLFEALQIRGYAGRELEMYLARLLFCLFADDTGIFPQDSFYHYIEESNKSGSDLAGRLGQLFQDLNRPENARVKNPFLTDKVKQADFKYINGGLFEEKLDLASFDKKMRETLLECLSFDWSKINPAIFGSMFQGVMDKEHRREIGAHYTSEENILKLINPLFMDSLRTEFETAKKKGYKALAGFHEKIASLKFLDPACGCGNFLIIAYKELRQLEHQILKEQWRIEGNDRQLLNIDTHFKVNVEQFYGIEILSWPCQIARTGMWLMDHLMNMEASEEFGQYFARIPLTKGAEIANANAHRMDWESFIPNNELSYILGNPPFVGYSNQSEEQKQDVLSVFLDESGKPFKNAGKIDYVAAWYYKASKYIKGKQTCVAFVSTNSITQGEQVATVWNPLFDMYGIHIDFAHRTFKWESDAKGKAAVHCVVVGFSVGNGKEKVIYDGMEMTLAKNINPYLIDASNVFVMSRATPLCNAPTMIYGNKPTDGGHLFVDANEYEEFVAMEPGAKKYIKRIYGADEYINNIDRYCLWLVDAEPSELKKMPLIMERVRKVREMRLASPKKATKDSAATPTLFQEIRQPKTNYVLIPCHSSENREYIPVGFLGGDNIATNAVHIIPNATLYHFGILTSSVHMAWTRAVCGRLEMRYRYSKDIVYNNFPWPDVTDKQKSEIERLAQGVLDARAKHPKCSLADLYDPLTMPPGLLNAHDALDTVVMKLYGFSTNLTETAVVAALMERFKMLLAASHSSK